MTGISYGTRTGSRFALTRFREGFFQASTSVWNSLTWPARLAVYLCTLLSTFLLPLGVRALAQATRLDRPPEVRSLEATGSQLLQQTCWQSHLVVLQLSPLRMVATVDCPENTLFALQSQLRWLYSIDESRGDELVLLRARVPFQWRDRLPDACQLALFGLLTILPGTLLVLQHAAYRWKQPKLWVPRCEKRSGRGRRLLGHLGNGLLWMTPLVTLAAVLLLAAPPLLLPLHLLLLALRGRLRKRARRKASIAHRRAICNGVQEAAIILMSFPPEFSAEIFKQLGPDHVHRTTLEIAKLPPISPELRRQVLECFQYHLDRLCPSCPGDRGGDCDAARLSKTLITFYLNSPIAGNLDPTHPSTGTGPRPRRRIFSCPTCDEVFIDEPSLQNHEFSAHQIGQPAPKPSSAPPPARSAKPVGRTWLRWRTFLLVAVATMGVGLAGALSSEFHTGKPDLRQRLDRFVDADPLLILTASREGQTNTFIGLFPGVADRATLLPLAQRCAAEVGLDPTRVACVPLGPPMRPGPYRLIPPVLALLVLACLLGLRSLSKAHSVSAAAAPVDPPTSPTPEAVPEAVVPGVEPITLELGPGLLHTIDPSRGGHLLARIKAIRQHITQELGFLLPGVGFRDNPTLPPHNYRIRLRGRPVAGGTLKPNHFLAVAPEKQLKSLRSERTVDPTYGLPACWITPEQRGDSERLGCMLFDGVTLMATQLTEVIQSHCSQLLTLKAVYDRLAHPDLEPVVYELDRRGIDQVVIWKVLKLLLEERVSVADLTAILEAMLIHCELGQEPEELVEWVRLALRDSIVQSLCQTETGDPVGPLLAWRMTPPMEEILRGEATPDQLAEIMLKLHEVTTHLQNHNLMAVILTSPDCRRQTRQLTSCLPNAVVLSSAEIRDWSHLTLTSPPA